MAYVPPLGVAVSPGALTDSYRFVEFLRDRADDAIVFVDTGGHGLCSAQARRTGCAFAGTSIVTLCSEPLLRRAERECGSFVSISDVRQIVTERLQVELSDSLVGDEGQLDWMRSRGWGIPPAVYDDDDGGWRSAVETRSPASHKPDLLPSVTAVIATYERPHVLPYCVEAFARQRYPRLEIVVVDDGSSSPDARQILVDLESRPWPYPLPRALLDRVGGFRHAATTQEDGELLARATLAGASIIGVPEALYWCRNSPNSRYARGEQMRYAWPAVVGPGICSSGPGSAA